jgi:hypothetical protein
MRTNSVLKAATGVMRDTDIPKARAAAVLCPMIWCAALGCEVGASQSGRCVSLRVLLKPRCWYLFYPRSQKASDKKLESLQFRLYDYQLEISLRIHVARLVLHQLNLAALLAPFIPHSAAHCNERRGDVPAYVSCLGPCPSSHSAMAGFRVQRALQPSNASILVNRESRAGSSRQQLRQGGRRCPLCSRY